MLVALTIFCFTLGFSAAVLGTTKPDHIPKIINNLFLNISQIFEVLRTGSFSKLRNARSIPALTSEAEDETGLLLTKSDVETQYETGSWQRIAYEEFTSTILATSSTENKFPCIYATKGYRSNDHRYIFVPTSDPSSPRNIRHIGAAMRAYLTAAHTLGPNTSLVIFCAPGPETFTMQDYTDRFWSFLRNLRISDTQPWPADVPANTDDKNWTFCFNGEAIFPIALTPAHEKRRSRYASTLTIAMQPKWVIDNLMCTPEKRTKATETVRGLLRKYDDVGISPDLANIGELGKSESRQLILMDHNEGRGEVPFGDMDV